MSIWSALWDRKIEPRNKYGDDAMVERINALSERPA